jgi:hypothetical protein
MDMRTRETASRPNHQPLPAYLDVSARKESGLLEKHAHTTPGETRFSIFCPLSGLAVGCGDSGSPLTLSPRPRSCARKPPVSNPLAVTSFEINASSGSNSSASDPLAVNSNEIKGSSGVAAGTPFFVEKSKAALLSSHTFTGSPRKPCFKFFAGACRERMPKDLELSGRNDPLADCQLLSADCFFVTAVTGA